ncbi:Fic family protein [Actinoplanes sp. M2I2]|uniref:Fic family protein n=1 Tax=Actinoplanes sp. M2I2 TaxID=1734444 RepID=UPI0020209D20|nr:Fic family protein [Actinoplanes sp. M2I2]
MPDQLTIWRRVREQVPWREVVPPRLNPVTAVRDGFTAQAAAAEDHRRQSLLLTAYADVRQTEAAGDDLTPDLTARWNAMLRGIPVAPFRRHPAYAKNGRDRYGLDSGTPEQYESCLSEAADPAIPTAARAARAYLDIAFFHPYDDGNARLAGLVLHFVLLRGGIELDDVRPLLTIVRRADDPEGAAGLARLIHGTAAATHRRRLRSLETHHAAAAHRAVEPRPRRGHADPPSVR